MTLPVRIVCVTPSKELSATVAETLRLNLGHFSLDRSASFKLVTAEPAPDLLIVDRRVKEQPIPSDFHGTPTIFVNKRREAPHHRLADSQDPFTEECLAEDLAQAHFATLVYQIIERRRLTAALNSAQTLLRERRIRDELSGLYNRRTFLELLSQATKRAHRYKTPLSLLTCDLDDLRELVARHGQAVSENAVQVFAQLLRKTIREVDLAGRWDFDIFVVGLPETSVDQARVLAERLRAGLHALRHTAPADLPLPTVSIGISGTQMVRRSTTELLECSQQALVRAKQAGGNQTVVWESPQQNSGEVQATRESFNRLKTAITAFTAEYQQEYFTQLATLFDTNSLYQQQVIPHAKRVALYAEQLAKALGWREPEIQILQRSAWLHDIGLAVMSKHMLTKTSPYDPIETELIRQHPLIGVQLLEKATFVRGELGIILHHHERFDGEGYPDRLSGTHIPIGARIIAIAESWDRMVEPQPWRDPLSREQAIAELQRVAGTQFDPDLTRTFLSTVSCA